MNLYGRDYRCGTTINPLESMQEKFKKRGSLQRKVQSFPEVFDEIIDSIREPIVVLDSALKVVKANHSFYQIFHVSPSETEGVTIYDLGNRQWDIPKLRELLEDILPKNSAFDDFEVEHTFENIGPKIMHLNARCIYARRKPISTDFSVHCRCD